jgi:hypothetical protein
MAKSKRVAADNKVSTPTPTFVERIDTFMTAYWDLHAYHIDGNEALESTFNSILDPDVFWRKMTIFKLLVKSTSNSEDEVLCEALEQLEQQF